MNNLLELSANGTVLTKVLDKSITELIIPNGVTKLTKGIIKDCLSLTSISIPNSLTDIGDIISFDGKSLLSINVGDDNLCYVSIDGVLYTKDLKKIVYIPKGRTFDDFMIPSAVTCIGKKAFANCVNVIHIAIPDSVIEIEKYAFIGCESLQSIDIPDSITYLEVGMFRGCKSLQSINVKEGNKKYASSDGILYSKDLQKIICVPKGKKLENFIIPKNTSEICYRTFSGCNSLTSITIPDNVTSIGSDAFYDCESLHTIHISNSITEIKYCVFGKCPSLRSMFIPENVFSIDNYAFSGCTSLEEIIVHPNNKHYASLGGILYSKDLSKIILVPEGNKVTQFVVPDGVTQIDGFRDCTSLQEIIIPSNVNKLGFGAFAGCNSLQRVSISGNVHKIEMHAFENCISLQDICLSDGINIIEECAFAGCTSLERIEIPDSVKQINRSAFSGCTFLKTIHVGDANPCFSSFQGILYSKDAKTIIKVPESKLLEHFTLKEGITEIGDRAFEGCKHLCTIDIPNSVVKIGFRAFANCNALVSISIPNSVISIGNSAFEGCASLSKIEIPESVEEIGDNAFENCCSLIDVDISTEVKSIGENAFAGTEWYKMIKSEKRDFVIINHCITEYQGDKNCEELSIPFGVTEIGESVFRGCSKLKIVDIPNSVIKIGKFAFSNCVSIKSIDIPNRVEEIGDYAFSGCTNLLDVDIPKSVIRIGDSAFSDCKSLKEISLPANLELIANGTFHGCILLEKVYIPNSIKKIGNNLNPFWGVFEGCTSLKAIHIPNSVKYIGRKAFHGSGMESLSIPKSVEWIEEHALCNCPLKTIEVSKDNPVYTSVEGVLYSFHEISYYDNGSLYYYPGNKEKGIRTLIKYPPQKEGDSFVLDKKIVALSSCAFKGAVKLKEIVLHNYLHCLGGQQTFALCDILKKITIPPVKIIPNLAFAKCYSLEEVCLPQHNKLFIKKEAFKGCSSLKTIIAFAEDTDDISVDNAFDKETMANCTLYIPSGSRWAYKHHVVFGKFKNIEIKNHGEI